MRLKAYAIWWDENWAMWNCTKWLIWKRCPETENINMKKIPRKEKYWNEKDAQMGKDCDEKDEKKMVYLLLIFLFRQLN